jgi:hypothetical protein
MILRRHEDKQYAERRIFGALIVINPSHGIDDHESSRIADVESLVKYNRWRQRCAKAAAPSKLLSVNAGSGIRWINFRMASNTPARELMKRAI